MSAKIEVVLLQSVKWLGNKWDVVSVALAYAKNVLIAQGKVRVADKQAIAEVQQKKEKQKKQEQAGHVVLPVELDHPRGVEPRLAQSKCAVLPLDEGWLPCTVYVAAG